MKNNINEIKEPLNVALYCRVSTGRQENEQTIESQLDEVKKKIAEDRNVLLPQNIFIDDGWTGTLLARPALDLLRDAIRESRFEALYVYDRGRLSRIFSHQEIVIEELEDKEIKFISLHDVYADTPEARVLQSMQGVFAEYERVKIVERMRRGKLFKARNGVIINGQSLYGLKFVKADKQPLKCEIDEDQAKVIKMIWNWFGIDRLSISEIKKRLFDLGIKPRKGKSEFWTKGPIVRILKCDSYVTGKAYYNKSESIVTKHPMKDVKYKKVKKGSRKMRPREDWIAFDVPKIINDLSLYEKIQKLLDYNQKYANKVKKYDYLLSGLVYCECGNRRCGDGSSKYGHFYYRCIDRVRSHPYPARCTSSGVNAGVVDSTVFFELKKRLFDYSIMKKYAEKWLKSFSVLGSEDVLEKQRLMEGIKKVEEEESRYSKAYGTGTIEFEQFESLMKDAKRRKISYRKQLEELSNKTAQIELEITADEIVSEVISFIKDIDFSDKFKVIRDIIDKVTIIERSGVEICAHLPLPVTITEKLGYEPQSRFSRASKCREVNAV